MPLFMDVHNLDGGVAAADVAKAHEADLKTQDQYGVNYLRYWVDEGDGKIFCLVDAPDADAANTVHREAHGLVANEIYPVRKGTDQCPQRSRGRLQAALILAITLVAITFTTVLAAPSRLSSAKRRATRPQSTASMQAKKAGYGLPPEGPLHECISSFDNTGAMGFHYINGGLLDGVSARRQSRRRSSMPPISTAS